MNYLPLTAGDHNCRIYAVISDSITRGILSYDLIEAPYSLKYLSAYGNIDGWGIGHYSDFGGAVTVSRGALRAYYD